MATFTNAQLAQQIANLIAYWASFNEEYANWLGGSIAGGPGSDGYYPLTDYTGAESLVACPALLSDNVSGYVGLASASADAAAASEAAALASEVAAAASAATATAQAVLADADRIAAELAEAGAVDAKVTAIAQAAAAVVSAAAALASETAAAASEAAAAISEANAAASEAAAATFNPALYAALADNETVTGAYTFSNYLNLTPMAAPAWAEGRLYYDSTEKALSYYNDEADVTINLGQENVIRARNTTGVTITNGSVVYISGAQGANLPLISLAQADALATAEAIGVVTHDIENNSNGYVTTLGLVRGLNTSSYTAGDELFLSTSVAGGLTNVKPTTGYAIPIGYVTVVNVSVGEIKVTMHSEPVSQSDQANWDTAYTYSQVGHLPLAGGTMTGVLTTSNAGDIQAPGYAASWGVTSGIDTGAFNATMGTGSAATWLLSGTSAGTFRGGIQVLDTGGASRLYAGAGWLQLSSAGIVTLSGSDGTSTEWAGGYTYSQVGHLPLAGGTVTGVTAFQSGMSINTTGSQLTLRETDGADPADRWLIDYNSGVLNFYHHDATPDTWTLPLQLQVDGSVTINGVNVNATDIGNWNTAYGWGDHSVENYAVTTGDTFTGALNIQAGGGGVGQNLDSTLSWTSGTLIAPALRWREADGTSIGAIRGYVNSSGGNVLALGLGWMTNVMTLDSSGANLTGNLVVSGTVDGVDIAALDAAVAKTADAETISGNWQFDGTIRMADLATETNAFLMSVTGTETILETRYAKPMSLRYNTAEKVNIHNTGIDVTGSITATGSLTLDNTQYVKFENSTGTPVNLLNFWSNNIFYIGDTGYANVLRGSSNQIDGTTAFTGAITVAGTISGASTQIANWNTAYGWGNHAGLYEPVDAAIVKSDESETITGAWAFNHADGIFINGDGWLKSGSDGYAGSLNLKAQRYNYAIISAIENTSGVEHLILRGAGTDTWLYANNSVKLQLHNTGVIATGTLAVSGALSYGSMAFLASDLVANGVSPVGNFGQFEQHTVTYADMNTEPAYWGWTYCQGNTNAPNTSSAQWYRGRFAIGGNYGKVTGGSTSYWLELAAGRTQSAVPGHLYMRANEATTTSAFVQVGSDIGGNIAIGSISQADISPSAAGVGQVVIQGNGYNGYVALDGTAMHIGHNSAIRNLDFDTDETTRMSITGSGNVNISGATTFTAAAGPTISSTQPDLFIDDTDAVADEKSTIIRQNSGILRIASATDLAKTTPVNDLLNANRVGTTWSLLDLTATAIGLNGNVVASAVLDLGHATDTTISRLSAAKVGVEGKALLKHAGSYVSGEVTFSTSAASGGTSGDIWYQYT